MCKTFMSGMIDTPATNAFGMGVDKADIRCVVHWEFLQLSRLLLEIGRAGRDGKPSKVVLLYRAIDDQVQRSFIEALIPPRIGLSRCKRPCKALQDARAATDLARGACRAAPSDINPRA